MTGNNLYCLVTVVCGWKMMYFLSPKSNTIMPLCQVHYTTSYEVKPHNRLLLIQSFNRWWQLHNFSAFLSVRCYNVSHSSHPNKSKNVDFLSLVPMTSLHTEALAMQCAHCSHIVARPLSWYVDKLLKTDCGTITSGDRCFAAATTRSRILCRMNWNNVTLLSNSDGN